MEETIQTQVVEFEQIIERGCGLDVHEKTVVATINGTGLKPETRTFDTFTSSLKELANWFVVKGCNPCSHGKHRCLLEASFQYFGRKLSYYTCQC